MVSSAPKHSVVIVRPVVCRPFVGRFEELAYLRERRLEAGGSHGGLVLIAGDAGVGKSRLISEFCVSLTYVRCRVSVGQCLEFGSRPFGPILDILARIDPSGFELGSVESKQEQFDAIVGRFAAITARSAVVVVVEDVHWADAATLDLLAYLGTKLQRMRMLVVVSFRPDELHPGHRATGAIAKIGRAARAGRIDLAPLRGAELQTFIDEALAGVALPDETRRRIALAGDGNPFFTEELLKSAVERSARADARHTELPESLRETLLERLRPLDDLERRVVTQAAVIGRSFGLHLLASTLDMEIGALLAPLRKARDHQLIEELSPTSFRFRHALTRAAIYRHFLVAELRPRHRTIALALERAPADDHVLESLAYHWWAAAEPDKAFSYNERAGDSAAGVHAHESAIDFYERALEFAGSALAQGTILEKIATLRQALTMGNEANAAFRAAADCFRDARAYEREAGARVFAAISSYILNLPDPTGPLEAMLARLDRGEYLARSRAHIGLAWLAATWWFPTKAEAHLAEVDVRARAEAPDIRLRFHNISAWVAMTVGDVDRFCREHAAWIETAESMGSPAAVAGAHYNGAMCFSFFGLHERAYEHIELAHRIARETESRHAREATHALSALCFVMAGDLGRARVAVDAIPLDSELRLNLAFASAWGSLVGAYVGDDELVGKWFAHLEATSLSGDSEAGAGLAEILMRRGKPRDAAAAIRRALPDCELMRGNTLTLVAAAKYGDPRDAARARDHLVRAARGATEMVERPALALFDAYVARRAGDDAKAAALARDAADGFERLRFPLLEADAREVAGDRDGACALYRRCGATYHVRRLERAAGPATDTLSPREREIAILAARGRSNLEIARELSISHKTVEKHLASTYQKLGVMRRLQLGAHVGSGA